MDKSVIVVLYFGSLVFATGLSNSSERIYNGEDADIKDYPYLVSVQIPNENSNPVHLCGGFIYSETFVVTAASCVITNIGNSRSDVSVVIGPTDLTNFTEDSQRIEVDKITPHDRYDATNTSKPHDIALLQLKKPIGLKPETPAEFIYYEFAINYESAVIAGWGAVRDEGLPTGALHSTQVLVLDDYDETNEGCKSFENYDSLYMMCAKPNSSLIPSGNPCQFDEGSPLVQESFGQKFAVGIASRIVDCDSTKSIVYTRLAYYYSWMTRIAGHQMP